ncbi:unnamed protein product [Ectocarpus fasciculatus]
MESDATCKAIVFTAIEKVDYLDIPKPKIEAPTDAVLRVLACGICGSDLHPFHGREGCATGTAFGHECVGEIVALGTDVITFSIGDRCAVPFSVACGHCFYCTEGMSARCDSSQLLGWRDPASGNGLHGAQSEYVRIPQATGSLYRLIPEISNDEGLLLGDIASTAAYAAAQAGAEERGVCPPADKPVFAVVGCGPVGLLAVALSRLMLSIRGYTDICIFAIDAVPARLEFARKWGAVPLLLDLPGSPSDTSSGDFKKMSGVEMSDVIKEASLSRGRSGRGADSVIECVGANSALLNAFDIAAPCGIVSSIGVHSTQFPFSPADVYDKNMTYKSGRCPARSLMDSVEKLLRIAKVAESGLGCNMVLTDVISHKFPLSEGPKGYEIFDQKLDGCIKAVLYPQH